MADGYPDECPNCGKMLENEKGFNDVIGIVAHDRVHTWKCPYCDHEWKRTEGFAPGYRRCDIVFGPEAV